MIVLISFSVAGHERLYDRRISQKLPYATECQSIEECFHSGPAGYRVQIRDFESRFIPMQAVNYVEFSGG